MYKALYKFSCLLYFTLENRAILRSLQLYQYSYNYVISQR